MQDDSWLHMGRGSIRMPATIATNSRCLIEYAEWVSWERGMGAVALGEWEGGGIWQNVRALCMSIN